MFKLSHTRTSGQVSTRLPYLFPWKKVIAFETFMGIIFKHVLRILISLDQALFINKWYYFNPYLNHILITWCLLPNVGSLCLMKVHKLHIEALLFTMFFIWLNYNTVHLLPTKFASKRMPFLISGKNAKTPLLRYHFHSYSDFWSFTILYTSSLAACSPCLLDLTTFAPKVDYSIPLKALTHFQNYCTL